MPLPWLHKLGTLAPLTNEERQVLAEAASRTLVVGAGQDVVPEGEPLSGCRVLLDGFAARYRMLLRGKRQIVSFGLPGDTLDLDALVSGRLDHGVTAIRRCRVAAIPHTTLNSLAERHTGIARALRCESVLEAAITREWLVSMGRRSSYQRIAHLLCETFTRLQRVGQALENGGERSFVWPLSQADLADATGLSTVHVNRMLQQLRAERLIGPQADEITILNWSGLTRAGSFTPDYLFVKPRHRT